MKITHIELRVVTLGNRTLTTSYGSNVMTREHLFVAVHDDSGTVGFGEGSPLPHFSGERACDMATITRDVFAPALLGADPFDTEAISLRLKQALSKQYASKAALLSAVLDLQAKHAGVPLCQVLGGRLRERVPVAGAVGIESNDTVMTTVARYLDMGIRTIKLKIGDDVKRDVSVIQTLRDEFGDDVEIRADANAGYARFDAMRFARGVQDLRLQYFEQPLAPHDLVGLAALRRTGTCPIAADESLYSLGDALNLIRSDAVDVFVVKLIKLGGLSEARKLLALAEAAGIHCVAVSPYETSLGAAANLHLVASSRLFPFATELGAGISEVKLQGVEGLTYEGGSACVPAIPGLGVSLPADLFEGGATVTQ